MATTEQTTTPETPAGETPQAPPEVTSLSEHRAAFPEPPKRHELPTEAETTERPRHRARSQTAPARDVDEIAEYTKRFRAADDEFVAKAGLQIDKKTGESERAFNVRRRAEIAEARRDAAKATETKPEPLVAVPPVMAQPSRSAEFTEKEPTLDQFANEADQYGAHLRALTAYDARKAAWDAQQSSAQTQSATARDQWVQDVQARHRERLTTHLTKNPTDKALWDAEIAKPEGDQIILTPIMRVAVETHGQGPQFVVELLKHPEFADELMLATNGQYAFDAEGRMNPAVATLQRRLLARVQAVKTGAAVSERSVVVTPRPPTPVRTGPQPPLERQNPEGDSRTLSEHRQKFAAR